MKLSDKQIEIISSSILISDIKSYINSHLEEFKKYLKEVEQK